MCLFASTWNYKASSKQKYPTLHVVFFTCFKVKNWISHQVARIFADIVFIFLRSADTHSSGNLKLSCHVLENITMAYIHFLEQHYSQRLQLNSCFNDSFAPISKKSELRCYQTSLNSLTSSPRPENNSYTVKQLRNSRVRRLADEASDWMCTFWNILFDPIELYSSAATSLHRWLIVDLTS